MDNVSYDGDKTLCENIKDTMGCREEDTDKDHMARFNERNPENYMSAVECLRLRSSLVEILEELKLRRMNDKDNEERIKRADQEKYQLIRKCESESQKLNEATKQYRKHLQDKDRMCEEKLSRMEEQLKQHKVFKDCTDKEINLLKDEIRKLEVVKYKLEKDVTEQERKLHLHVQSSEQHLNQLTETEESFKSLYTQCKQLSEAQAQLEESVQHAIKHNQALRYINEHQKCIVDEEKNHSLSLQAQLLEVRSLLQQRPDETSLQQYQQEITSLNQRLERLKSEKEKAEEEVKEYETKYEKVTQILEDTNRLLVCQIKNVELHKKNSSQQTLVIEQLQKELSEVKGELQEVKAKKRSQIEQHREEAREWRQKNSELQDELNKITEELADQKKTCSDLEELNTTWSNQNIQLTEQLHSIKELMNKPKQEQIQQTSLSCMNMVEQASQTEVIRADISVQTNTAPQRTESSQTLVPDFTVSTTQTRNPALANSSSQTDKAVLHNVSVQAEIIKYNSKERLFSQCIPPPTSSLKMLSQQSLASQTESVFAECSQFNLKTVSGKTSQSQQDTDIQSVSQPESQAQSVITSQSPPADESRLQNVGSQLVSEDNSQSMTVDSSLSETSRQVKADSIQTSTDDDIQESNMEHQNVAKRHSFQFSSSSNISKVITSSRQSVPEHVSKENTSISKNDNSVEWRDGHRTVEDGAEMIGEVPADKSKMETDIEPKICSESIGKDHIDNKRDIQTKISSDHGPTKQGLCESEPADCGNDRNKTEEVDQSSNTGGTSPRSPGGSRLKLSLSKLRNPTTTLCQTNSIDLSLKSTATHEGQRGDVESLKLNQRKDEPDCDIRYKKGILKDVGQENDYKRKSVSFGSPLQNVQQISQTSVESVSRDDGDKDLFSDSEDDTEDKDYKERPSVKCLPTTTLIIRNKRVKSVNSVASLVDEYLPDTSLPKTVSVLAVNDDDDLEMPSTNTTSINKEMKCGKSNTSTNSPCGNDQSTLKLLYRDKTSVCAANRGMPVLEIPSVPKLQPSTLSNQYKRTIDAILNKGKKRKTDH
ncbi:interaptin-like [Saccostrea echinata]|uniref:interaptin-like n=1 Tax=Saccostrea echinata TaxID=191078 RepID=UPI002A7F05C0|nr:interaptin-like [Saccostrea echinata]